MKKQSFELKNEKIKQAFLNLKKNHPEKLKKRLNLSWSNWGFGLESLEDSCKRLNREAIQYIELHGNHYGNDLGYIVAETLATLTKYNIRVSGICGMFSSENDLSSNNAFKRQNAIDYIKRELSFAEAVGAHYLLVVPATVGRPKAYDDSEFERSTAVLRSIGHLFKKHKVKAAIEPIRSAETSLIHTIREAQEYLKAIDHVAINHINGDVYHMFTEETHIGEAILSAGDQLVNLHMADSNRAELGAGFMDLDQIIMSLYLIGFNREGRFVTPEPLGAGADPYPAANAKPDKKKLDWLVHKTATYFRERENELAD
jgi:D-psicose/D-tagatose/L-ribulose 3-epimerase